ncbi:MAG TPA: hypothetical protein VGC95_04595, partial [Chitinophagaceae bacterium]
MRVQKQRKNAKQLSESADILRALRTLLDGDFSVRMAIEPEGKGEIAKLFNRIVEMNGAMASALARISRHPHEQGNSEDALNIPGATGAWANSFDSLN